MIFNKETKTIYRIKTVLKSLDSYSPHGMIPGKYITVTRMFMVKIDKHKLSKLPYEAGPKV